MICGELPNVAGRSKETFRPTVRHPKLAWTFTENVCRLGLEGSMGTIGDCYDNATSELQIADCHWPGLDSVQQMAADPRRMPQEARKHSFWT